MSFKKKYFVGIMDWSRISDVNEVIGKYAGETFKSSSHMFFLKQPVDPSSICQDVTHFVLEADDEDALKAKLDDLIEDLNELDTDYTLFDDATNKPIVSIEFAGKLFIRFDNIKVIKEGTFDKINDLKMSRNEFGYCKGFKPKFRPVEGRSIEDVEINSEIIYLFANSSEDLLKLKDYMYERILEIDSEFILEFKVFEY